MQLNGSSNRPYDDQSIAKQMRLVGKKNGKDDKNRNTGDLNDPKLSFRQGFIKFIQDIFKPPVHGRRKTHKHYHAKKNYQPARKIPEEVDSPEMMRVKKKGYIVKESVQNDGQESYEII